MIEDKVQEFNPDIIGLSIMFDNLYKYLEDITNIITYEKNIHNILL